MTAITSILIFIGFFILLLLEPKADFMNLLFEVVSAACTVGLSRGITPDLHNGSLFILSLLMFAGRLGPLTLAYLIATPKRVDLNTLKPTFKLDNKKAALKAAFYSVLVPIQERYTQTSISCSMVIINQAFTITVKQLEMSA